VFVDRLAIANAFHPVPRRPAIAVAEAVVALSDERRASLSRIRLAAVSDRM
jgi:hypothetical protein